MLYVTMLHLPGEKEACGRCMQAHHELIRGLIKEHRLYEVKTVGIRGFISTWVASSALNLRLNEPAMRDRGWCEISWELSGELFPSLWEGQEWWCCGDLTPFLQSIWHIFAYLFDHCVGISNYEFRNLLLLSFSLF